ncbi:hypothetical protein FACS1894167_15000 [Synergistales bacterium]|nr:hypothetical protein FACS1894167_15000 [Synergistales bacterium]
MTLDEMKNIDIRTVNPDTLVDMSGYNIDIDLPKQERMRQLVRKAGNPYCFKSNNIAVKVSYADTTATIDDRMENYLRTM